MGSHSKHFGLGHDRHETTDAAGNLLSGVGRLADNGMELTPQASQIAEVTGQMAELFAAVEAAKVEIQGKEQYLRTLLETLPAGIIVVDAETRCIQDINPHAARLSGRTAEQLIGCICNNVVCPAKEDACPILDLGQTVDHSERVLLSADGGRLPILKSVVTAVRNGRKVLVETFVDISGIKEAEAQTEKAHNELAEAQKRLIDLSRLSGMAEVATGVLHNVGNVLNSVNVSANILGDRLRESRVSQLGDLARMLQENKTNLADFLTNDPRGQRVIPYLEKLARHLTDERDQLAKESRAIILHVGHVKEIVAMQQSYARTAGVLEKVSPMAILEDALHITEAGRERHGIEIQIDAEEIPAITTDRNKVLQIVLNLLRNAKEAVKAAGNTPRRIAVRQRRVGNDRIQIQIADNGIGIAPANLARIFSHGFTTKRDGHGFGLHSGALAAQQLGGSLKAESEGTGQGATFTLELPLQIASGAEEATK